MKKKMHVVTIGYTGLAFDSAAKATQLYTLFAQAVQVRQDYPSYFEVEEAELSKLEMEQLTVTLLPKEKRITDRRRLLPESSSNKPD